MTATQSLSEETISTEFLVSEESAGIPDSVQDTGDASPASKGGKARMNRLSSAERSVLAGKASKARWKKQEQKAEDTQPVPLFSSSDVGHCPACIAGQSLERGEGFHTLPSLEHPIPVSKPVAFSNTLRPNPIPKEFGSALAAAERRLGKAIQERAEAANKWAVLQAEIPYLERTIAALRGQPAPLPPDSSPEFSSVFPWSNPSVSSSAYSIDGQFQTRMRHPQVSKAQGGAVSGVDLSESEDAEDRFLRDSNLPGGEWR